MIPKPPRRQVALLATLTVISAFVACGDSPTQESPKGPGITANIDGVAYAVDTSEIAVTDGGPGIISISARPRNDVSRWLELNLESIGDTGVYPLGVIGGFSSGNVTLRSSDNLSIWDTPRTGAAGSVHITSVTPTRIAGTFTLSVNPCPRPRCIYATNAATGTRQISNGRFDIPIKAPLTIDLSRKRFKLSFDGTVNGVKIKPIIGAACAACAVKGSSTPTVLGLQFYTEDRYLSIWLQNFSGVSSYPLSQTPNRSVNLSVFDPATSQFGDVWHTWQPGNSGSITVARIQDDRITLILDVVAPSTSGKPSVTIAATITVATTSNVFSESLPAGNANRH